MQVQRIIKGSFAAILLLIVATSFNGCYYDNVEELYPNTNACDTLAITFNKDIRPIMENNCTISGCHVAGGSGNGIFNDYQGVLAKVQNGSLHRRVLDLKDMPPTQPLNMCQQQKIAAWINLGAPE